MKIDLAPPAGARRLPIYLLLDCSESMAGTPLQELRKGVDTLLEEVGSDAFARSSVYFGLITFGGGVEYVTGGLVPAPEFWLPPLEAAGSAPLGAALRVLCRSLETEVRPVVKGRSKGDWKPLAFLFTDGRSTDRWRKLRREIEKRHGRKLVSLITVGCGPEAKRKKLKELAMGPTFRMEDSPLSFRRFFTWISQSFSTGNGEPEGPGEGDGLSLSSPVPRVLRLIP